MSHNTRTLGAIIQDMEKQALRIADALAGAELLSQLLPEETNDNGHMGSLARLTRYTLETAWDKQNNAIDEMHRLCEREGGGV